MAFKRRLQPLFISLGEKASLDSLFLGEQWVVRKKQFHPIACPVILQEFERVLIKKFLATREEDRIALQVVVEVIHSLVHPSPLKQSLGRDLDDDAILAGALEAEADYLVTGDMDLPELKAIKRLRIIFPIDFELLFND